MLNHAGKPKHNRGRCSAKDCPAFMPGHGKCSLQKRDQPFLFADVSRDDPCEPYLIWVEIFLEGIGPSWEARREELPCAGPLDSRLVNFRGLAAPDLLEHAQNILGLYREARGEARSAENALDRIKGEFR